jgi:hypothetical protein
VKDGVKRPLDELRAGERVRATVTSRQPWGFLVTLNDFEPVGASLDVIRRSGEPGVRRLAADRPAVGATIELVIGAVRPWHSPPGIWVDLTAA